MTTLSTTAPSLTLMLMLGMRHGLDPDHLAAIDGLTLRAGTLRPGWAPWMGAMFSLGHGIVVLTIVAAAALASERYQPPAALFDWLEWIPPALLLLLAALNARALLAPSSYALASVRSSFLPSWLGSRTGPWAGILLGMLFAAVFDTAIQAAAWGYAATALGGIGPALTIALMFALGMACTDLCDGWVTARVMRTGHQDLILAFRRRLGWPIVVMCAGIGTYMVVHKLRPTLVISETWYSLLGGIMLAAVAGMYAYTLYGLSRRELKSRK